MSSPKKKGPSPKRDEEWRFGDGITPGGYRIDEVTSALQKDVRRGNEREALFWATELAAAGFTAYVWKRLRIIATEDVGIADSSLAVLVKTLYENWKEQKTSDKGGERHANLFLTHAVMALCRAEKSRIVDHAYCAMTIGQRPHVEMPDYALDMHTKRGRQMGRGVTHFYEHGAVVSPKSKTLGRDTWLAEAKRVDVDDESKKRRRRPNGEQGQLV